MDAPDFAKAMANAAHEALAGNLDDAHFWLRYAELVANHVGSTGTIKRAA